MKVKEIKANGTYMMTSVERCTRLHGLDSVPDAWIGRPMTIRSDKMMMHAGKLKRHYLLRSSFCGPVWALAEDMAVYDPVFRFTPDQVKVYNKMNNEIASLSALLSKKLGLSRTPNRVFLTVHALRRLDLEIEIDFALQKGDEIDFANPRIVVQIDMYSDWLRFNETFEGTSHKALWDHIRAVFKKEISAFDAGTAWLRKSV